MVVQRPGTVINSATELSNEVVVQSAELMTMLAELTEHRNRVVREESALNARGVKLAERTAVVTQLFKDLKEMIDDGQERTRDAARKSDAIAKDTAKMGMRRIKLQAMSDAMDARFAAVEVRRVEVEALHAAVEARRAELPND